MGIRISADIQRDIARLQDELDVLNARRRELGEENWAVDLLHTIICHHDHTDRCGYHHEDDFAFDKDNREKARFKVKYRKIKSVMEGTLGQSLSHEECVNLIHAAHCAF